MVKVNFRKDIWWISDWLIHFSTEYPRQINVLERFNIYQELILALLYKFFASFRLLRDYYLPKPILFYVYSCFTFAGFGVTTLYLFSWALTGRHIFFLHLLFFFLFLIVFFYRFFSMIRSVQRKVFSWLYGLLVFTWMLTNIDDSTRVFFTVNLRENFALPFFWLQNTCIIVLLRSSNVARKKYYFISFFATFLFTLFWQFTQVSYHCFTYLYNFLWYSAILIVLQQACSA